MEYNELPHILLLYATLIPSVRLCGHCQLCELEKRGYLAYRHSQLLKVSKRDLQWADTVILGRLDDPFAYPIVRFLKNAGKQLLYILDDDLLNVPPECTSYAHYSQSEVQERIRGIIALSDGIITPSPILAKKYLLPGQRLFPVEEPAIAPVPYEFRATRTVKIGFAASPDRTCDLETILDTVLLKIKHKYGALVQFEFFGAIPPFAKELDAVSIGYRDSYDAYRKELSHRAWDIGLAPMPDTPFHACKHYNKYCEYAAAGIVGVFSRVQPYSRLPGLYSGAVLCENDSESWYQALCRLIEDPQYRETLRKQVSQEAHGALSEAAVAEAFYRESGDSLAYRAPHNRISPSFWLHRAFWLLGWAKGIWNSYGFGIFGKIFTKMRTALHRRTRV